MKRTAVAFRATCGPSANDSPARTLLLRRCYVGMSIRAGSGYLSPWKTLLPRDRFGSMMRAVKRMGEGRRPCRIDNNGGSGIQMRAGNSPSWPLRFARIACVGPSERIGPRIEL